MKIARFVLKIVGASLALAALVCCVVAYWDRLAQLCGCAKDSLAAKKAACCRPAEYDDFADVDD